MKPIFLMIFVIACLLVVSGVAQESMPQQPVQSPAVSEKQFPPPVSRSDSYRLAPGDVVDVKFFMNPELNELVQIRPDGKITLQLVGEVGIAGLSVEQAAAELQQRFAKTLKNLQVSVQVRSFASQKVYVTGEVTRPGVVVLPGELTLLEAISEAGGLKKTGNRGSIVLIRKGVDNMPYARKVSLVKHGKPSAESAMLLRPYDIVMVPETKIARIDRWVDEYLRQTNPINLSMGFSYVFNNPGLFTF